MDGFVFKPMRRETNYVRRLADEAEYYLRRADEDRSRGDPRNLPWYESRARDNAERAMGFAQVVAEYSARR